MSIQNNPTIVTDGLKLYIDMGNKKSWVGPPITNLLSNKNFTGWFFNNASYNTSTEKLITNTVTSNHYVVLNSSLTSGVTYTQSVLAKAAEKNILQITPSTGFDTASGKYANYDLSSGVISGNAGANASMTYVGSGWYRCSYTDTAILSTSGRFAIVVANSLTNGRLPSFSDPANYGLFLRQPQLEAAPFASPFIDGTRPVDSCILDLTKNQIVSANTLIYDSEGTFSFDGDTSFISVPDNINYSNGFSLNFWIYSRTNGEANFARVIDKSDATLAANGYSLLYDTDPNPSIAFRINESNFVSSNTTYHNNWLNVSTTVQANGYASIYINGTHRASALTNPTSQITSSKRTRIGNRAGAQDRTFDGKIAVAQIYDRVLTENEVVQNFSALRGRYGV